MKNLSARHFRHFFLFFALCYLRYRKFSDIFRFPPVPTFSLLDAKRLYLHRILSIFWPITWKYLLSLLLLLFESINFNQ